MMIPFFFILLLFNLFFIICFSFLLSIVQILFFQIEAINELCSNRQQSYGGKTHFKHFSFSSIFIRYLLWLALLTLASILPMARLFSVGDNLIIWWHAFLSCLLLLDIQYLPAFYYYNQIFIYLVHVNLIISIRQSRQKEAELHIFHFPIRHLCVTGVSTPPSSK